MGYSRQYRRPDPNAPLGKARRMTIYGQIGPTFTPPLDPETKALHNERYRRGECVDCGKPEHMAGRPRCQDCDSLRTQVVPGLQRRPQGSHGRYWRE